MYTDFANFILELEEANLITEETAKHLIEKFLVQQELLTQDEVTTLAEVKQTLDDQKAAAAELAKGT